MRPSTQTRQTHARQGLTVVEVLVAMILVSVGMLGIAGSSALALRSALDAAHRREAVQRATTRFSTLAAAGCAHATGGSSTDTTHQISEQWTVVARSASFATVSDSISWMSARGPRSFAIASAIPC